jgi:hypothetical protein
MRKASRVSQDAAAGAAKSSSALPMPFISLLTPTFNRRAFFPQCVRCMLLQTYPRDRMEWIILDDGTDRIADLLPDPDAHPWIRYIPLDERLPLGAKRNRLHSLARGDIMIYIDDDDYYPPQRAMHAVQTLLASPSAVAAGCSELPTWFLDEDAVYVFGPFGASHATCGTLAFRRALVDRCACRDDATHAEETQLLDGWRVPLVQLDHRQTILCIAHGKNTIDKRRIRDQLLAAQPPRVRRSAVPGSKLVMDAVSREFYRSLQASK